MPTRAPAQRPRFDSRLLGERLMSSLVPGAARSSRILTVAMSFPGTAPIGVLVVATISLVKRFVAVKPHSVVNGASSSPPARPLASTSPEQPPRG